MPSDILGVKLPQLCVPFDGLFIFLINLLVSWCGCGCYEKALISNTFTMKSLVIIKIIIILLIIFLGFIKSKPC